MCTCNSSSCNGTCGTSLIVNKGKSGPAGVGIQSITSSVNANGETIIKITLTSGVVQNFTLPAGQEGTSVDHASITSSTLSNIKPPIAAIAGAIDTYTLWADADETIVIGTFQVYNGSDGLSDSTFSNLGPGSPVYVAGSEYSFRTISSDNLTVTNDSEEVFINDPRHPLEIILSSTVENGVYNLDIASPAYYQPIEITNKTPNIVTIAVPSGYSFEETPYLSSAQGLYLLPKATLRVWKSSKNGIDKVSVLSYKAKTYSAEITDFQNNFNYDTDRIYARATESRQVSISGRLRYAGSSINDNGIVFNIPLPFRPARTVYFMGTMSILSTIR